LEAGVIEGSRPMRARAPSMTDLKVTVRMRKVGGEGRGSKVEGRGL